MIHVSKQFKTFSQGCFALAFCIAALLVLPLGICALNYLSNLLDKELYHRSPCFGEFEMFIIVL